jgi:hypothetical protein
MRLQDALSQIELIRAQLARSEVYRGTRAATLAATAAIAFAAACLQNSVVPAPVANPGAYICYWSATAVLAFCCIGVQVLLTYRKTFSGHDRATTRAVLTAVAPPLLAGAAVTPILWERNLAFLLPGLWPLFAGVAVFAGRTHFPAMIGLVGLGYLAAGLAVLLAADGARAFEPWIMGLIFTSGQLAAALVFYWNLERKTQDRIRTEANAHEEAP